jgi:glycosyltransferase involved in cell wall biosynthesis
MLMKKKILFVGGTTGGGVATINNEVKKIFEDAGHACFVVDTERMKSRFPAPLAYVISYVISIAKIIIHRPHVVYLQLAQTGYLHQSLFLLFAKMFARETIAHFHAKGDLKGTCTSLQFKKIMFSERYIDKMILLTEPCRMCLVDNGWKKETHVIPNFISTEDLPADIKPVSERKQFLYIGRMDWEKGIFEILEIAKRLEGEEFVFVGYFGDEMMEKKFVQDLESTSNARWLGPKYGREKYEIIADSKLLIFPTMRDEFPMTLIESSILGCVPLVSLVGSVGEIIKNGYNGVYITPDDVDGTVAKISELKDSEDLQRIADNGIKFARANFTSEAVREMLVEIVG